MKTEVRSDKYMHIFEHLRELRKRLFISLVGYVVFLIIAFVVYDYIVDAFIKFYSSIPSGGDNVLFVNSVVEGMTTKIKVSLLMGLTFSLPVHIYNSIAFVFPALEPKQKRLIVITLICSFTLMILSTYLSYFKILPVSINFLTNSGFIPSNVGLLLSYETNLFYVLYFVFWSMVAFQLPIVFVLLMAFNVIKRKTALQMSRYIIIVIFALAAVVTPPDVVSQVGLALPLVVLFFLALLIAKIFKFGE